MKHITEYNNWNTTAGDININYGDVPKPEKGETELTTSILNYIKNNKGNIFQNYSNDNFEVRFITPVDIRGIKLFYVGEDYFIEYENKEKQKRNLTITKDEYDFLMDNFIQLRTDALKKEQEPRKNDFLDIIVPIRNNAKKYNI